MEGKIEINMEFQEEKERGDGQKLIKLCENMEICFQNFEIGRRSGKKEKGNAYNSEDFMTEDWMELLLRWEELLREQI